MKNYEIEIDGQVYHVTVRELPDDADMGPAKTAKQESPATQAQATGHVITAPMAGTILRVLVQPGQSVKAGDNLLILEAMKMENEIVAPSDGVIKEIHVKPNEAVDSDQVLLLM